MEKKPTLEQLVAFCTLMEGDNAIKKEAK